MSESLSGISVQVKMLATLANVLNDGTTISVSVPNASKNLRWTNGVGVNQADRAFQIAAGVLSEHDAQETIDLYDLTGYDIGAGVGKDALGQSVTFANVAAILVCNENASGAVGQLEVYPATTKGWSPIGSHTVANGGALKAGGLLLKAQPAEGGFDVVDGTSYRITLRANGGPVNFSLFLLARSADVETSSSSSSLSSSSISTSSMSSSSISTSSSSVSTSSISTSSSSSNSSSSNSSSYSSSSSQSSSSVTA